MEIWEPKNLLQYMFFQDYLNRSDHDFFNT